MIRIISRNFGAPKFSSTINNQNINTNFNGSPRIMYGIPSRWERDSFERPYRPEPLIKYGVPDEPAREEISSDDAVVNEEDQMIIYGIPDEPNPYEPIPDEQTIKNEERIIFDKNKAKTEETPDEVETPSSQKEKPSYFKRLWFAILGKDC